MLVTLIKSQKQQKPYINPGGDNGRQSNASDPRATAPLRPQQHLLLKKKKLIYAFMHGPKTIVKEMTQMRMYLNAAIHSFPGCSKNAGWACNIVNKFLAKFILIFMYINHITLHW